MNDLFCQFYPFLLLLIVVLKHRVKNEGSFEVEGRKEKKMDSKTFDGLRAE